MAEFDFKQLKSLSDDALVELLGQPRIPNAGVPNSNRDRAVREAIKAEIARRALPKPGVPKWLAMSVAIAGIIGVLITAAVSFGFIGSSKAPPKETLIAKQNNSGSGSVQIAGDNTGHVTINQNSGEDKLEMEERTRRKIVKLLQYPSLDIGKVEFPTLLEKYLNQLPVKLFAILGQADEEDIKGISLVGLKLQQFFDSYYNFRQQVIAIEGVMFGEVGKVVSTRYTPTWSMYIMYSWQRYLDWTPEEIRSKGDITNIAMTTEVWDEAEKVYQTFRANNEINHKATNAINDFKDILNQINELSKIASKIE